MNYEGFSRQIEAEAYTVQVQPDGLNLVISLLKHPVLLEPILSVTVLAPSEYTAKVLQLISGKRGQIQGFEASAEWKGWDQVTAYLPQAEMHDFIVELRSSVRTLWRAI